MERTGPQEKSNHAKNENKLKLDPSHCNNEESITVMKPSALQLGSSSEGESISKLSSLLIGGRNSPSDSTTLVFGLDLP
jgi:hypothetical protein